MVINELLTVLLVHASERVELALEVASEAVAGLDDVVHDLLSVFIADAGAERELLKVAADTDTGGLDHRSLILGEGRALEVVTVHLRHMLVGGLVAVVDLNHRVEELVELGV